MQKYANRTEAGKTLAEHLLRYANRTDCIVLALPRGGVPVAYEVAKILSLPMDIFIVRKLGVPGHEELAMGALASDNTVVFNENIVSELHIPENLIKQVMISEEQELKRRELAYRGNRPYPTLSGNTIILVDDGIATGATMRAAIKALRKHSPAAIVVAVPVAAHSTCEEIKTLADKIVCPMQPDYFNAVGLWYENFSQTTDDEVRELLLALKKETH